MKALIWKDLMVYRRSVKPHTLIFDLLLFAFLLWRNHYIGLLIYFCIVSFSGAASAALMFADDAESRWEKCMVTMPVTKAQIVWSRYFSVWLISGMTFILYLAYAAMAALIYEPKRFAAYCGIMTAGFFCALVAASVSIVTNYLKNDNAAGIFGILWMVGSGVGMAVLYHSGIDLTNIFQTSLLQILGIVILLCVVFVGISYKLSVWGFCRRHS